MPLTVEARKMFADHVAKKLDEWEALGFPRCMIFDPKIKPRAVVEIRDRLIWWLRTRCWQSRKRGGGFLVDCADPGLLAWSALSYPNIAEILHLRNHTTVLASLKRTREKIIPGLEPEKIEQAERDFQEGRGIPLEKVLADIDTGRFRVESRHEST